MGIKIEHGCTLLQVFDMPTSVAFYRDILGFEVIMKSQPAEGDDFDWGLLRHGSTELMLNTQYEKPNRPPAPNRARVAAHDDTALFFSCKDLDAAYAYLRANGIDAKPPVVRPYGMKQVWLKDPDGYTVCFQWRAS